MLSVAGLSMQKIHPSPKRHYTYGLAAFALVSAATYFFLGQLTPALPILAGEALLFLLYAASATAHASLTSYSLDASSLVMEKSFIWQEKKIIPVKSIDNLHMRVSPLGRLLGISDVYVDTPGSESYELLMRDVPSSLAEQLAREVEGSKDP